MSTEFFEKESDEVDYNILNGAVLTQIGRDAKVYGCGIFFDTGVFDTARNEHIYTADILVRWNDEQLEFSLAEFVEKLGFEIVPCSHWGNKKTCKICRKD